MLAFPCNQFGGQEPAPSDKIESWVRKSFDVEFPIFEKIDVNGVDAHPIYKFLKQKFPAEVTSEVTWNFSDVYIIDKVGNPVYHMVKESWENVEEKVEEELAKSSPGLPPAPDFS